MWIFVPDSPTGLNLCSRQDVPRSLLLQGVMVHDRHVAALSCSNAFHGSHLPLCLPDPLAVLGRCLGLSSLTSLRPVSPVLPRNPGYFLHWLHVFPPPLFSGHLGLALLVSWTLDGHGEKVQLSGFGLQGSLMLTAPAGVHRVLY